MSDVLRGADFSSSFYCVHSKNLCYKAVQNINIRSPRTNVFSNRKPGNIHLNYEQRGKNGLEETSRSVLVFCSFIPERRRDKKCTQCWDWKSALDGNKLKIGSRKGDSNNGRIYTQAVELWLVLKLLGLGFNIELLVIHVLRDEL